MHRFCDCRRVRFVDVGVLPFRVGQRQSSLILQRTFAVATREQQGVAVEAVENSAAG